MTKTNVLSTKTLWEFAKKNKEINDKWFWDWKDGSSNEVLEHKHLNCSPRTHIKIWETEAGRCL